MYDVCMKRTNIYLPEPALNRLTMIAAELDVSVASLIRAAIADYLKYLEVQK